MYIIGSDWCVILWWYLKWNTKANLILDNATETSKIPPRIIRLTAAIPIAIVHTTDYYIYIYIYRERERERDRTYRRQGLKCGFSPAGFSNNYGFHTLSENAMYPSVP